MEVQACLKICFDRHIIIPCFRRFSEYFFEMECDHQKLVKNFTEAFRKLQIKAGGGHFFLKTVSTRILTDLKLSLRGWVGKFEPRNS